MLYAVYADLSRRLTEQERSTFCEALDATVPGSGCVGLQKGPHDEVYFSLETLSETTASEEAERYMAILLRKTALDLEYALTLQRLDRT